MLSFAGRSASCLVALILLPQQAYSQNTLEFYAPSLRSGTSISFGGNSTPEGLSPEGAILIQSLSVLGNGTRGVVGDTLTITVFEGPGSTQVLQHAEPLALINSFPLKLELLPSPDPYLLDSASDLWITLSTNSGAPVVSNLTAIVHYANVGEPSHGLYDIVSFGATPNDDTDDDYGPINDAVNEAIASGGGTVFFPAGHFHTGTGIFIDKEFISIRGVGIGASVLHAKASLSTPLVHYSATSGALDGGGLFDISFVGTSSSPGNVLLQDVRGFRATNIETQDSGGYGIRMYTESMLDGTFCIDNQFAQVWSHDNSGIGQHYQSGKNCQFSLLRSDLDAKGGTDGDGGIVFEGASMTDNGLRETTQCTVNSVRISDSGRFGLVVDGATKYVVTNAVIHASQDSAVLFTNTNAEAASTGCNSGALVRNIYSGFNLRNNAKNTGYNGFTAIETEADSFPVAVRRTVFSDWVVTGGNTSSGSPGAFDVRGWTDFQFAGVEVSSIPGVAWIVGDGPVCADSEDRRSSFTQAVRGGIWANCSTSDCDSSIKLVATTGVSRNLSINQCRFESTDTSASGGLYELEVGANYERVSVSDCMFLPSEDGYEAAVNASSLDEVRFDGCISSASANSLLQIASAATLSIPFVSYGSMVEVTGSNDVSSLSFAPAGTRVALCFTDASPGLLTSGSGIDIVPSGTQQPSTYQCYQLISTGSGWRVLDGP